MQQNIWGRGMVKKENDNLVVIQVIFNIILKKYEPSMAGAACVESEM